MKRYILLAVSWSLVFAEWCSATNYYVDGSTGNDDNVGSQSEPFLHIWYAMDEAGSGDTIYVKRGILYAERVVILAKQNLTLSTYGSGSQPTIDGTGLNIGTSKDGMIQITNSTNIVIDDFNVIDSPKSGVSIRNTSTAPRCGNITIKNCTIEECQNWGILSGPVDNYDVGPQNIVIEDNEVREVCKEKVSTSTNSGGEGITMQTTDTFDILDNEVYQDYKEGILAVEGSTDGLISGNHIHDEYTGNGYTRPGIYVDGRGLIQDVVIRDNIVANRSQGIVLASENPNPTSSQAALDNIDIFNNLTYAIDGAAFQITDADSHGESGGHVKKNISVFNNTFVNHEDVPTIDISESPSHIQNLVIQHNILASDQTDDEKRWIRFWDHDLMNWTESEVGSQADVAANMFDYDLIDNTVAEDHAYDWFVGDADFVDKGTGALSTVDFSLESSSDAISAGDPNGVSPPATDIDNPFLSSGPTTRSSSDFDVGAFEY